MPDLNTPIRSGAVTGEAWLAIMRLDRPEPHDVEYIRTVWRYAPVLGLDPGLVLAQWSHETAKGTSTRWNRDHNPAGIGIPADDTPQPFPIASGEEAAKVHLACLNLLVAGTRDLPFTLPPAAQKWINRVWVPHCQQAGRVETLADLSRRYPDPERGPHATWAWDSEYAQKVLAHHRWLFPADPPLRFAVDLIPAGNPNRPGAKINAQGAVWATVHENGNPRSGAVAERNFTHGGGGEDRVSYHFAVDAERAIQLLPLDEIGWHAADGCDNRATDTGCFLSYAIETCQLAPLGSDEWERTLRNLVRLIVMVKSGDSRIVYGSAAKPRFANALMAQHNRWYPQKNCPQRIRDTGRWQQLTWAVETALMERHAPAPYATPPRMPDWTGEDYRRGETVFYAYRRKVTAKEAVIPRTAASRKIVVPTGPAIAAGTKVQVYWLVRGKDEWWYVLADGSRVPAASFDDPVREALHG